MNISSVQNPNFNTNGIKLVADEPQGSIDVSKLDPKKYDTFDLDEIFTDLCKKVDPDKDTAIYDPNNLGIRISGIGCAFGCGCKTNGRHTCLSRADSVISNVDNAFASQQRTLSQMISKEQDRLEQFQAFSEEKSYYQDLLNNLGYQHKGNCKHKGVTMTEDKYGFKKGSFVTEAELKKAFESVSEKINKLVSPEKSKIDILSMPRSHYNYTSAAIVEATGFKGDCFEQITKDSIMFSYDSLTEENFIEWTNAKIDLLTEKSEGFKNAADEYDKMVRKAAKEDRFLIWGMSAQNLYKTLSGKSDDDIKLPDGSMPKELNTAYYPNYSNMSAETKSKYIDTTSVNAMFMNTSEVKSMIAKKADSTTIAEHLGNIYRRIEEAYSLHKFGKKSYYQLCMGMEEYVSNLVKACGRIKDTEFISNMINDIRYGK